MTKVALELAPTKEFHQELQERFTAQPKDVLNSLQLANQHLDSSQMTFGNGKTLRAPLSALLLKKKDVATISDVGQRLFALMEKTLAKAVATPTNLRRYFPDHERIFPFLAKTVGSQTFQVVSRYDMALTTDGELKLLELNSGCPGGLLIADSMTQAAREGLGSLDTLGTDPLGMFASDGTVPASTLADELLDIEKESGLDPHAIGVLNDENNLSFELDLLVDSLRERDREVIRSPAQALRLESDHLLAEDHPISVGFNKFRISTPKTRNHGWKAGFQERYAAFLEAQSRGLMVSVNNLYGMVLAEDKSLLSIFTEPEFRDELNSAERKLVDDHILWTARLKTGPAVLEGQAIDLLPFITENRGDFVVKPANEGRGFGVVVGREVSDAEWQEVCQIDPDMPKVVQRYVPSLTIPVIAPMDSSDSSQGSPVSSLQCCQMLVTLGLVLMRGKYRGLVSRVSSNSVTNVAKEGFGQGVLAE